MIYLVGSQGYLTFLYDHKKYNRRSERKIRTWVNCKRKKGSFVTLHSLCICRLTRACILRETSTKCTNNSDISNWLARSLCCLSGFSSHLSDFCWLWHSLDSPLKANCSPLPSVVDCLSAFPFANSSSLGSFANSPSGFSRTCLSSATSGLVGDLELRPLFRLPDVPAT